MRARSSGGWVAGLGLTIVLAAAPEALAQYSQRHPIPAPPPSGPADPRFLTPQSYGRACTTQWGVCVLPAWIAAGTPCHCYVPAYGSWVPGVAREWYWYAPPQTP